MSLPTIPTVKGKTYDDWLAAVDALAIYKLGLSIHDLGDFPSIDLWADGTTPGAALKIALDWQ